MEVVKDEKAKITEVGEKVVQYNSKSTVKKDKLCFVGFAPSTLYEVNKLDDTWDVMGMNELYKLGMKEMIPPGQPLLDLNKFTMWMEIHSRGFDNNGNAFCDDVNIKTPQGASHIANLNAMPFPVLMRKIDMDKYNDVKNAVAFPFEEIVNFFGMKYFTNTVSWMIGWGVYENFRRAGVDVSKPYKEAMKNVNIKELNNKITWRRFFAVGVDMAVGWYQRSNGQAALQNEYASQRPSCEALIGWVKGLSMAGIDMDIEIPAKSSLMKKYSLYGFEEVNPEIGQQKMDLLERLSFLDTQEKNLTNNIVAMSQHLNNELGKMKSQEIAVKATRAEVEMMLSHLD